MTVSHETIYKSLYVQGRGELRKELARCLRTGRAQRRPRGRIETRGHIPDMVMISERPAKIADRRCPPKTNRDDERLMLSVLQRFRRAHERLSNLFASDTLALAP
jgi:IS30 family transposase